MVISLLVSIGVSNNLSGPEGFEEVGHVIEVHITATAADTAAKEEHCLIQPVLYVEYSMVHNGPKFPQTDCGFS